MRFDTQVPELTTVLPQGFFFSNIDDNTLLCTLFLCPVFNPIITCLLMCSDLAARHKGGFLMSIILGNVYVQFFL